MNLYRLLSVLIPLSYLFSNVFGAVGQNVYVVNQGPANVLIVNTATNTVTGVVTNNVGGFSTEVYGMGISTGGYFAYVGDYGNSALYIMDTANNMVVGKLGAGQGIGRPEWVAFSGGGYSYVYNWDATNMLIFGASNTVVGSVAAGNYPTSFSRILDGSFAPSGTYAYIIQQNTGAGTGNLFIINGNTVVAGLNSANMIYSPQAVAFHPSGTYAYASTGSNVVIISTVTNTFVANVVGALSSVDGIGFSPDGSFAYLAVQTPYPGNIEIVSTATNSVVGAISFGGFQTPSSIAFSPFSSTIYVPPTVSVSSCPSNTIVDPGQYDSCKATAGLGTTPYTYNFFVVNTLNSYTVNSISRQNSLTTNTFTWYVSSADNANSPEVVNVVLSDSNATTPTTVNTVYSGTFTISSAALSPSVTLSLTNTMILSGQYSALTATVTGGASPYVANFVISNSVTNKMVNSILITSASPSKTVYFPAWYSGNTLQANVVIKDSATSNEIANSIYSPLGFNSLLAVPTIAPSYSVTNSVGQVINYAAYVSGGTSPYTYNFLVYNSVTKIQVANMLTSSNSFAFTMPASQTGNTIVANVFVTDSSSFPSTTNSILSGVMTVIAALSTPTISPASAQPYDSGTTVTFAAYVTGGSLPYTYNFIVYNSITNSQVANMLTSSNSFAYSIPAGGNTLVANVAVTDNINDKANSILSGVITANSVLTVPTISPSASNSYGTGFLLTFAAYVAGGTLPYTYNFIVYNSITNAQVANMLTSSNSFTYTLPASQLGNTLVVNVVVTDSAAVATKANSILSGTITVVQGLSTPTISPSSPQSNTAGQTVTFATYLTGGALPYTYNFIVYNSANNTQVANMLTSSNSFAYTISSAQAGLTLVANVFVTDSSGVPQTVNSVLSGAITISSGTSTTTVPPGCGGGICGSGGTGASGSAPTTQSTISATTSSTTTQITTTAFTTTTILPLTTVPVPPIQVTVRPAGQTTPQLCNGTATGYSVTYTSLGATFNVGPGIPGCFSMTAFNATAKTANVSNTILGKPLVAVNFTVSNHNLSVNSTMQYPCNIPSANVAPFILKNGTWKAIRPFTVNSAACTVTFAVPSDPVIAVFQTSYTNSQTTTVLPSSVTVPPMLLPQANGNPILIAAMVVVVLIVAYYLRNRTRKGFRR